MRLIDVEAAIERARKSDEIVGSSIWETSEVVEFLDDCPIVDAVEVVRCKDCKHWNEETEWCNNHSHFIGAKGEACHPWESNDWKMFDADYFCKDGERKEVNEK